MTHLNRANSARQKYAAKKHVVLRDADLRSAWFRLKIQVTSITVVGSLFCLTLAGALAGVLTAGIVRNLGAVIPTFDTSMLKLFPMFGALFGLVLGWFLRNRPLAPLDGHDLAIVSKKVEAEPDVFAWVVEAVKRGDTLRERDYAYIARAYNAIVVASAEDDRCAFMEIERAAAIAEISVTRRVGAE